jgi:hypothetical protein
MHLAKFNERMIKKLKGDQRQRLIDFLVRREAKATSYFFKQF